MLFRSILLVQQDITTERDSALALEAEHVRLQSVMEAMSAFLYLQATDHTIPFANSKFRETFGDPEGRTCHEMFHSSDSACVPCSTLEVLKTRNELIREWTDDRGRVFELHERPFVASDGTEFALVVGTEITDLIQATQALRASERRFRELAEMLPEVLFEATLDGRLTYANQVAFTRFGYSQQQLSDGLSVLDMLIPENREQAQSSIERLIQGKARQGTQYTAHQSDGTRFPTIIHASVIRRDGHPVGLRGILIDVSEQVEAQRAIRESEARHRLLFESAPIGIGYHSLDGKTLAINVTAMSQLKGSTRDYLGCDIATYYRDPDEVKRRFALAISSEERQTYEDRVQRGDTVLWYQRTYTAIRDESGEPMGVQVISSDITAIKEVQEALEMAEHIMRLSPVGMMIYRYEEPNRLILIDGNQEAARLTRLTIEECVGKDYTDIWPRAEEAGIMRAYLNAYHTNTPYSSDDFFYQDDRWSGSYRVRAFRIPGNRFVSSFEDISEQKKTQRRLAQSEKLLHDSERIARLGGWEYDLTTGENRWTQGLYDIYGVDHDFDISDIDGFISYFSPEDRARVLSAIQKSRTEGEGFDLVTRFQNARGKTLWTRATAEPVIKNGKVVQIRGNFQDITSQKQAEEQLRTSEAMQRSILRASPVGTGLIGAGAFEWVSDRICEMTGYSPEELIGQCPSITAPSEAEYRRIQQDMAAELSEQSVAHTETKWRRKDGSLFDVDLRFASLDPADESSGGILTVLDITQRKSSETALRQSEENYRTIFNSTNDAIMLHDSETGSLLDVNDKVAEMFGYPVSEFIQLPVSAFSSGEPPYTQVDALEFIHVAANGAPQVFEWHSRRKNEDLFWTEVSLRRVTLLGTVVVLAVVREISERKRLEARLRQSQKLESIGTLASGVAHEINNPLMGMINYAELISSRTDDDSLRQFAEGIKMEGDRVAKIVRNLLSFSRQDQEPQSPAQISDIVDVSLTLIGSLLRKDHIQIEVDVPDNLPLLRCRSQQIQQVLINLITNARDSLNTKFPEVTSKKTLRIHSQPQHREGRLWLRTTVEDSGTGIAKSIANRVFDPFFTTKTRDEGTGLGLSISYGIIRDHGGHLTVESEPGHFTRFHIDLPTAEDLN